MMSSSSSEQRRPRGKQLVLAAVLKQQQSNQQVGVGDDGHHHHYPATATSAAAASGHHRLYHLSSLPEDVLFRVTGFLDARSLLNLRAVNRHYYKAASQNKAGWENLCQVLWKDKMHVASQALQDETRRLDAYRISIQDAKERNHVTRQELCYDEVSGEGTIWSFRFKESAGTDWTSVDPWWRGLPCRKMVFLENGTVKQYVCHNNDDDDGGEDEDHHQLMLPTFGSSLAANDTAAGGGSAAAVAGGGGGGGGATLIDPPLTMTWRFLTRPMDLPTRPLGSYVRFTVGGRDVPTYAVRRSPTGNWGFVLESCWGVYASFELPPKRATFHPSSSSSTTSRRRRNQRRRLRRTEGGGALWVESDDDDDEDEGMDDPNGQLQDDSSLLITSEIQWREAFLYNVGARVLPEGDEATDEFDRAWGGLR